MKKQGDQFEDLVFPGVRFDRGSENKTYRGKVPVTPEGHTRLWRATNFAELQRGHWANKPLTAYGGNMLYMDVPHEKLDTQGPHYLFGRDASGRNEPMPGPVNQVQFYGGKSTESSDYGEYNERWGD